MTKQEIRDEDVVVCWSCDKEVEIKDLTHGDGFCPYCGQEIDRSE